MESELGRVVDALPGFVWTALPDGQIDFLNRRWSEYTGLAADRSSGRGWQTAVHPDDLPGLLADLRPLQEAASIETEARLRGPDGRYRWFLFRAQPSADDSGQIVKWCGLSTDIESRKQAREALRASERRAEALLAGEKQLLEMVACGHPLPDILQALRRLVEDTASGCYCSIVLLDAEGTKLQEAIAPGLPAEFNDAVRGWPLHRIGGPCQVAARDKVQVIMPDVATDTRWRNGWRALAQKHNLISCWSTPIVSLAGKVLGTFALYQSEAGDPNPLQLELIKQFTHIASIAIDGAQRDAALRQSEARLAQAERELQLTIDMIPAMVATYRPDGSRIFLNRVWCDYTGLTREKAMSTDRANIAHPDDLERVEREWQTSLATGEALEIEARLRRADGAYRWHAIQRVPALDDTGAIVKWYGVAFDIEERKRAEEALRDSELNSRLAVDGIPGLVAVFGPEGEFEFVNRQVVEYVGRTLEDLKLRRWDARDAVHPDDLAFSTELFKQSMASGEPFEFEVRLRRFDGAYRWFQSRGYPLRDANGRIVRWYNLLIDIDERKRAEDALRQSEARASQAERELQLTLDTIPVMVWRGGANGYVQHLNKRWFEYTGTTPEQMRGRRWKTCVHPDDLERHVATGTEYVAAGMPIDCEARLRRFDGEYRRFLFRPAPLRDETGKIVAWYGTIIDIEDRKRAEEKTVEAERELQHVIDHIPTMVATYSADGLRLSINKRLRDYIGRPPGEDWKRVVHNRRTAILDIHPDDAELAESRWRECIANGEPYQMECRVRRYDGTYGWVMRHRVPVRDETGNIVRWYGVGYETDDRKRAEEKVAEAERELQRTIDNIPVLVGTYNADGERLSVNKRALEVTGLSPEDAAGEQWVRKAFHPDEIEPIERQWRACLASGEPFERETRTRTADGSYRWHLTRRVPLRDESGRIIRWYGTSYDIDDEKRAKEELRRSEALLAKAQRLSLTGSFSFNPATEEATWSDEVYRIYEYQPGTRVTLSMVRDRYHPDDIALFEEQAVRLRSGATDLEYEHRLLMPDGSIKHVHMIAHGSRDEKSGAIEYIGAVQDVTQRRVAEQELRRSEAYLAEAQRIAHIGSWAIDYANRKPIHSSEELCRLFGFDPAAGLAPWNEWRDRVHPEDREMTRETIKRSTREKTDFEMEYRVCHPDGTLRYLHVVGHPVLDAAGNVAEFVGTSIDVTQRRLAEEDQKRVQEELRRSEAYLAEAQRVAHIGSWAVDYVNRMPIHSSEEHRRLFGFDPADGMPPWRAWMDRIHPEDRDMTRDIVKRSSREKTDMELDYRICHPDGTVRYVHDVGHPVLNEAGELVEFVGSSIDVTQRRLAEEDQKRVQEELRRSEAFLAKGQEASLTGTFSWRSATGEFTWSEQLYRIYELEPGIPISFELIATRYHPEDKDIIEGVAGRARSGVTNFDYEHRLLMPGGAIKYVHVVSHGSLAKDGNGLEYFGAVQDVTQRRVAEEALDKARSELAHVSRVMTLSTLTASIAHEVNQPLAGIITNASTCLRMLAADPPNVDGARETARRTIRDGNRAADVITRLRALFSKKAAAAETVDLNEATREALSLVFSDLLRNRIALRSEIDEDRPLLVTGDRVQLQQVILNLVRNASDSMSDVNDRLRQLLVKADEDDEGNARLIVKDAGVGFAPQGAERLFDSFYTTKSDGMGIGLSVSRSIIESHGGKLWAEANDGPGATFSFSIPRLLDGVTSGRADDAAWASQGRGGYKEMRNS